MIFADNVIGVPSGHRTVVRTVKVHNCPYANQAGAHGLSGGVRPHVRTIAQGEVQARLPLAFLFPSVGQVLARVVQEHLCIDCW